MKSTLIAIAALSLASPAFAQVATSTSTSTSDSQSAATVIQSTTQARKQTIKTTPTAVSPSLAAAGVHSCAGSTSAGVGATGFGVSLGTTWEMVDCNRRAYAATLAGMGQNLAALELICQNAEVRSALNSTGVVCPSQQRRPTAPQVVAKSSALGGPEALRAAGCRLVPNSHWECPAGVVR